VTAVDDAPAAAVYGPELGEAHQQELARSVVAPELANSRGYRTLYGTEDDRRLLRDAQIPRWGWREDAAFPGLLLPMYRVSGELISYQWKPCVPQPRSPEDRNPPKYVTSSGLMHLDVPPVAGERVRDVSVPLWITEGIKKADCLAGQGRAPLTVTGVYNWRNKHTTLGDWEDVPLRGRSVVVCFDSDARDNRNVMTAMQRLGRWLESKGTRDVQYVIVPADVGGVPVKGVDDFFAAGGTLDGLREAARRELPTEGPQDAAFTDAVLADTLCSEALDGVYRWASGLGWMHWSGRVWEAVTDVAVTEEIRLWALDRFAGALDRQRVDPDRQLSAQIDGWRSVLGAGRLRSLVSLARGVLECAAEDFDADKDLFNCPNGVVDLRTGQLLPSDPDLLMTKIAGCDYVKGVSHPDWDLALTALPDDVRGWFQLRMGQAATGWTPPDDVVVISEGSGSNGKSTTVDAMTTVFGQYRVAVADRALLGSASDNHPTEMMDFLGARYAVLEETPEGKKLDTVRLKKTAGTKEITARRIRKDSVTFPVTHSMFISTNNRLMVTDTDHGTWRRLALLKWPYTYQDSEAECKGPMDRAKDPTLRQRVAGDPQVMEAALAWVVQGASAWYAAGRIMPEHPARVKADTMKWRREADPVMGFLDACTVFDPRAHVMATELFEAFDRWMVEQKNTSWSMKLFKARFEGHQLLVQNGVAVKKVKYNAGLSRWNGDLSHPAVYSAWTGIRFNRPEDDASSLDDLDGDNSGTSPFDHDPGGPASSPSDLQRGGSAILSESPTCKVPGVPANYITALSRSDPGLSDLPELPEPDLGEVRLDTPVYTESETATGTDLTVYTDTDPAPDAFGGTFDWEEPWP
jgi:P4 family phage/plasmid primase-like protien